MMLKNLFKDLFKRQSIVIEDATDAEMTLIAVTSVVGFVTIIRYFGLWVVETIKKSV